MRPSRTTVRLASLGATLLLASGLAGCGLDDGGSAREEDTLTVLAAASLTDAFATMAEEFEADHDGTAVEFSFGSSTELAEQVGDGAPGDVLATADEASMRLASDAGVTGQVIPFATNVLTIVTPPGNPAGIRSLADLRGTTWVRCADEVPCGRVARAVLADHDVTAEPVSLEEDVRATLDKVTSGEVDAGLVYATDAVAAGDAVETIAIPGAETEPTTYFVAALDQAGSPGLAEEWTSFVGSARGRELLAEAGFGAP